LNKLIKISKKSLLFLIRLYQRSVKITGLMNNVCRFEPTCSEYTYQAIDKYGVMKGIYTGIKRIVRCNPFCEGGVDPVK